jgi:protocadherin-16/23
VNIAIEDVNDNPPEFEASTVRISVAENLELGTPLYAAHARDKDSGPFGLVRYRLAGASSGPFAVESSLGHITLTRYVPVR